MTAASRAVGRRKTVAEAGAAAETGAAAESTTEAVGKPMSEAVVKMGKFFHYDDRGSEAKEPWGAQYGKKSG